MKLRDIKESGIRKFALFTRQGGNLSLNIWDLDANSVRPLYLLTLSETGEKRIANLINGGDNAIFPLATWADATAMEEGGERAPGYE